MVDFINEVEEELRKDKYNQLLRKFGPYIVAVIFMIVAVTGYTEYNKSKISNTAKSASAAYVSASKVEASGDLQAAINKFTALASVAPDGYAGLSLTRAAGLKVQLGDMDGAVSLFDQAAEKFSHPIHKDLASLKAAYILLDQGRYDDVQARAGQLALDGAPYADLAKELLAHAALKSGDTATARTQFAYLSNAPGVLGGVKSRAGQALALIAANRAVETPKIKIPDLESPIPNRPETTEQSSQDNKDEQE
ncbi:MAG: tetratricopeptide repeat protein [Robiginitomaculum sp.]|nr:tetratricopeptide repeat protein [Robiginitomaculum sp.]